MIGATCQVCGERIESPNLVDAVIAHLRVFHHDDHGEGPLRWPDGELVVVDATLSPEQFGGAA